MLQAETAIVLLTSAGESFIQSGKYDCQYARSCIILSLKFVSSLYGGFLFLYTNQHGGETIHNSAVVFIM